MTGSRRPVYEVVVGVLSARHHHDLREAIRGTWMGYVKDHPDFQNRCVCVSLLFIFFCPLLGINWTNCPSQTYDMPIKHQNIFTGSNVCWKVNQLLCGGQYLVCACIVLVEHVFLFCFCGWTEIWLTTMRTIIL